VRSARTPTSSETLAARRRASTNRPLPRPPPSARWGAIQDPEGEGPDGHRGKDRGHPVELLRGMGDDRRRPWDGAVASHQDGRASRPPVLTSDTLDAGARRRRSTNLDPRGPPACGRAGRRWPTLDHGGGRRAGWVVAAPQVGPAVLQQRGEPGLAHEARAQGIRCRRGGRTHVTPRRHRYAAPHHPGERSAVVDVGLYEQLITEALAARLDAAQGRSPRRSSPRTRSTCSARSCSGQACECWRTRSPSGHAAACR
jgi:hypothetical protein